MSRWSSVVRSSISPRKIVALAVAGVIGDLVVGAARRTVPPGAARSVAVRTLAGGIVAGRRLEALAEEARLAAGDLVAEARAALGEEAPVPEAAPGDVPHEH